MTVAETSKAAHSNLKEGTLDNRVYNAIATATVEGKHGDIYNVSTRREVAEVLDIQASTVAGAVNRLIKAGWVEECGHINCCVTNKRVKHIVAVKGRQ